ncbi:uncharacterized protein LOC119373836 [Rhipicephalus sanguineus]|uniref:uncharacterized protein LOC119373836 n=1 Tax=Rhipicephalus sanguineus TaxID=34632 RepID=UPI0020C4502F|nr:uncharacterized protein LOC119373836 [Rhipicephalus sanguineus]
MSSSPRHFAAGVCRAQLKDGCKIETLRSCGDDFVPKLQEQLTCSKKFINTCVDGLTKVAATLAVDAFEEDVESICSVGSERHEAYVEAVGCMNSVGKKLNSCWRTFRGIVQKAIVKAPIKDVLPYTCCSYHDLVGCTDQSLTPCESTGGKEFALDLLQRVFGDAVNLVCNKYKKGSEACKALPKLPSLGAKDRKVDNYVELLVEAAGTCRAQLKAGCKLETLRACGDDFVPYAKKTHLYSSGDEFKKACENQKQQIACTGKFVNDCMEGVSKIASLPVVNGFKKNVEGVCNVASKEHEAFGKAVGCMNSVGTKLNSCWRTFRAAVQKAVIKAQANKVVFYTCCSYHDLTSCADQSLTPCESGGGKRFALDSLLGVFGESLNLACGDYTAGSQACRALPKLPDLGANDRRIENYIELLAETAIALGHKN